MCLYKVDREARPCTVGYKVMRQYEHSSCPPALFGVYRSQEQSRPIGRWLDEADFSTRDAKGCLTKNHNVMADSGDFYPRGWHVFHKKSDALTEAILWDSDNWKVVVVKVIVRKPLAVGTEVTTNGRVTVAKNIKIVEVISNVQ